MMAVRRGKHVEGMGDAEGCEPPKEAEESVPGEPWLHLPQLEKIQEVLPSRRDEAHYR